MRRGKKGIVLEEKEGHVEIRKVGNGVGDGGGGKGEIEPEDRSLSTGKGL